MKVKSGSNIPLSANPTKWSNTLKQFVGNLPTNCLSLFNHFVGLGLKGTVKWKTKWRWSNLSGLTIFEFINHDKATSLSARTSPNFSHFPRQLKRAIPFDFSLERDPKNIFYCQLNVEVPPVIVIRTRPSSFYYVVGMSIHTRNLPVCNSGQYIYITY